MGAARARKLRAQTRHSGSSEGVAETCLVFGRFAASSRVFARTASSKAITQTCAADDEIPVALWRIWNEQPSERVARRQRARVSECILVRARHSLPSAGTESHDSRQFFVNLSARTLRQMDSRTLSPDCGGTRKGTGCERTNPLSRTRVRTARGFTPTFIARKVTRGTLFTGIGAPGSRFAGSRWMRSG